MDSEPKMPQGPDVERNIKIKAAVSKLYRKSAEDVNKIHQEIVEKATYLREKYPNAEEYAIFRDLILSTPGSEPRYDDLPGDDSVEKFVDYLLKKYE